MLRLNTYAEWARASGRPWNLTLRYACREAGTADFTRDPAIAQAMRGLPCGGSVPKSPRKCPDSPAR